SVEYFRYFADNPNNLLILSCYQGPGSMGRKLQDGDKKVRVESSDGVQDIEVKMRVELMNGLSPHSGRNELLSFFNNMYPKPKRILVNHGEVSKSLDLASSLYKLNRIETSVPRNLEIVRLR
ncbi:MAG: MBL fold metallo-hydrolase RNA specificity domain-containing protein, partial [Candidatus Paceibacterota bacterium]